MQVNVKLKKIILFFLSLCIISCVALLCSFNNKSKAFSQPVHCDDYALALTDYNVGNDIVKVTSPNGDVVNVKNGKIFLGVVGDYTLQYSATTKTLRSLFDYPEVSFTFDGTLESQYAIGDTFTIPTATIVSDICTYDKYTITIKCNNEVVETLNSGALNGDEFTITAGGTYKVIYSCTDDFSLKYTATKTLTFSTNNDTSLIFQDLPAVISYGDSISFGAVYAVSNGKTFFAELKATTPSGAIETIDDIVYTPKEAGVYSFTASANVNGRTLSSTKTVNVVYSTATLFSDLHGIDPIQPYQDLPTYSTEQGKSAFVSAQSSGSYFYASSLIDLKQFKETPLIEFVPYSDSGSSNSNSMRVTLTDAYNPSNTLQVLWWYKKDVSYEAYFTTFISGREYGGISNEPSSLGQVRNDSTKTPHAYGAVAFGCRFNAYNSGSHSIPFNFVYNCDENAVYIKTDSNQELTLVMDYDNTDYVSFADVWEGFSRNLVYLKVEFLGDDTVMGAFVKSLCGTELDAEILLDPKDETCFMLDTEGVPNKTVINKDFVIPTYTVNSLSTDTVVSVSVLKDNVEKNNLLNNGVFKPTEIGEYVIKYVANDKYGKEIVKTFEIEAVSSDDLAITELDSETLKTQVYSQYAIPNVTVTGGIGNVIIDKEVYLDNIVVSKNGYVFIDRYAVYKLVIKATDYLGYTVSKEYNLVIDNDYVSIVLNENIITLRAGIEETLPDFETYDYKYEETPAKSIEVYDKSGNKLSTLSYPFDYTAPAGYDSLVLKYIATGVNRTTTKEVTVKVLPNEFTKISDAILFDGEIVELTNGIVFCNDETYNNAKMPRPIPADDLGISFGIFVEDIANLDKFKLIFTDAKDDSIKVEFAFYDFNGKTAKLMVNNDGRVFKVTVSESNIEKDIYKLNTGYVDKAYYTLTCIYDNVLNKMTDINSTEIGNVKTNYSGTPFGGFTSGLVFVETEVEVNSGSTVKTLLINVSEQVLSPTVKVLFGDIDIQGPDILFSKRMLGGRVPYGTEYTVSAAKAYDVFQANSTVTVKIVAPNGSTLHNGVILQDKVITLNQYGIYKITYTAKDGLSNSYKKDILITVYGDALPELNVSQDVAKEYKKGTSLTIPNATAKNKNGEETSLSVKVYIIDPKGQHKICNVGDVVKLTQSGVYNLVYYAEDEFNNLTRISYRFIVR